MIHIETVAMRLLTKAIPWILAMLPQGLHSPLWVTIPLAALMAGALGMHFTMLGIEVMNDGGQLFIYALTVAICSAFILWVEREKIISLVNKLLGKKA